MDHTGPGRPTAGTTLSKPAITVPRNDSTAVTPPGSVRTG